MNFPYVITANKQDLPGALSEAELRRELDLREDEILLPCVAKNRASVRSVLIRLFEQMPPSEMRDLALQKLRTLMDAN
jgi:uncharacterized protein